MRALKLLENNVKQRTGLIAKKLGMSSLYAEDGSAIPVTVLEIEEQFVSAIKEEEKDGYNAIQLACGDIKVNNVTKPLKGHFAKAKVAPKRKLAEFVVAKDALLKVGSKMKVTHFVKGQYIDVTGSTIGKGFAGVMQRWNFRGLEATHGVSITHRSHGSTGQRQDPGKVFKNKKMAGHLGNSRVTIQNLEVVDVDEANSLLIVKGAVPGNSGSYVVIKDAIKKILGSKVPYPASYEEVNE
ncbi:MAG: 50S ribosomal protein L3 [Sphingobacteriia bacterium]|nr:50S ribosomal protein L3 [Sphingobacteriia bacterium]